MPQSRRSFISAPFLAALASQPLADVLYTNAGSGTFGLVGYTYQPNGTDDADAIQQLLNEAAKRGGSVLLKSGQEPYRLGHPLELPDHASLSGESPGTIMVALRSMHTMLEVDAPLPLGNRLGTLANLVLDGAGLADTGVSLKACVQRSFGPLAIRNCRQSGLRIVGSQNNLFTGVDVEYNGGGIAGTRHAGLELLAGAGNNCFVRCEFNRNGGYQAMIAGKGVPPGAFEVGPSSNLFLGCVFERRQPNTRAAIFAGDGRMNTWLRCDFSHEGPTMIEGPTDQSALCGLWRFSSCAFSGSTTTTFLSGGSRVWSWLFDGCLFENFERVTEPTSFQRVAILPGNQLSNIRDWSSEAQSLTPPIQIPGGTWDSQHLVLGNAHIWIDPAGDLRYSTVRPTGPQDGRRLLAEPH